MNSQEIISHAPIRSLTEGERVVSKKIDGVVALMGLDWATDKHDLQLLEIGSDKPEHLVLKHGAESIEKWVGTLRERFGKGARIAVCLELSKGAIVSALEKYDLFVLYPVNPASLAKYRQAWAPSRAKDDPSDALLLLELLRRYPDKLKPLERESTELRTVARLVEIRRNLVDDRVRLTNRLTAALKCYFPQVLEWFDDKNTRVFVEFLARWPSLDAVKKARDSTLEKFFFDHNVRHRRIVDARIEAIRQSIPLTKDPAVLVPEILSVQTLVEQLRIQSAAVRKVDAELEARSAKLVDYDLFASLPGAGPALAPRLLVAFGENRERFQSAQAVAQHVGIAPVTERSGQKSWVHKRNLCNKFLRQSLVEWAGQTIPRSFWAGAYYRQQRDKGASHQVAIRALAFKWIRVLFRCWQDRKTYDESVYLNALKRSGSPLLAFIAKDSVSA
jgi:transposase